ncbi:MAG: hypothetical protein GXO78_09915 [Calditrichaeota bacterium]|nr:hypothetical protein [Calditrichota bacterium]
MFKADSNARDSGYVVYDILAFRVQYGKPYDSVSYSIHLGGRFPSSENQVYKYWFSVQDGEYNPTFADNGIKIFKEVDLTSVGLRNISIEDTFWILLEQNVFDVFSTISIDTPAQKYGNSYFYSKEEQKWHHACDFMMEAIVLYKKPTFIPPADEAYLDDFILHQNLPNPFNPGVTQIPYTIKEKAFVEIIVYDGLGRQIATLVSKVHYPGNYLVDFEAWDLSSGIYLYVMKINGVFVSAKRMILMR